jgi:histidyl-tRNA synthetase
LSLTGQKKIVGDDERAGGEVAIKDVKSGKQRRVKRGDFANALQNRER